VPFGLVDDKLHSHVKWRTASKGARALWTTAKSWCMDQLTDGYVPKGMLRSLDGTPGDAKSLVAVGLWESADGGWQFHDWLDYQPDAASIRAKRDKESVGGQRGNHTRWHAKRGVFVAGCEFCESGTRSGTREVPDSGGDSGANPPRPRPIPTTDSPKKTAAPSVTREPDEPPPDSHPQPEFGNIPAVLQAAGLAQAEVRDFLVDLKVSGARNTSAVVSVMQREGKLPDRIAEWRNERNLAAEASAKPKAGKRTTDDRVADAFAMAEEFRALEAANPNVIPLRQIEGA